MNQAWVDKKNCAKQQVIDRCLAEISNELKGIVWFTDAEIEDVVSAVDKIRKDAYLPVDFDFTQLEMFANAKCMNDRERRYQFFHDITLVRIKLEATFAAMREARCNYERFLDSVPMQFDGDIIITDPCYIERDDVDIDAVDDLSDHIDPYMERGTIYGDWSCTVFNSNTREPIGQFCADGGMVCVCRIDDVLKYNPSFDYHIRRPWTTALIKDFCGTVQFVVKECNYKYNGKKCTDYEVEVVGHGVNKRSGEPIDFVGRQTGL